MTAFLATREQHDKLEALEGRLKGLGAAAVSFSGGVDSTFLLAVAHGVLGERVFAVTETNTLYPARETGLAASFCQDRGIRHVMVENDPLAVEGFAQNPRNRCYLCKRALFENLIATSRQKAVELGLIEEGAGLPFLEGSNTTDLSDFRPGAQAVQELGVLSPLQDAGLSKQDIRDLSRELGVPTWDKPSFACLATRFVYGQTITPELLERVDRAEQLLIDAGLGQLRVRMHDGGDLARVEVAPERIGDAFSFLGGEGRDALRALGFKHVSLDMDGYRSGSMNG